MKRALGWLLFCCCGRTKLFSSGQEHLSQLAFTSQQKTFRIFNIPELLCELEEIPQQLERTEAAEQGCMFLGQASISLQLLGMLLKEVRGLLFWGQSCYFQANRLFVCYRAF